MRTTSGVFQIFKMSIEIQENIWEGKKKEPVYSFGMRFRLLLMFPGFTTQLCGSALKQARNPMTILNRRHRHDIRHTYTYIYVNEKNVDKHVTEMPAYKAENDKTSCAETLKLRNVLKLHHQNDAP